MIKFVLFLFFILSSLTFAYFMTCFVRELKKSTDRQEPPTPGLLIMVLVFLIIMLAEAIAAVTLMLTL